MTPIKRPAKGKAFNQEDNMRATVLIISWCHEKHGFGGPGENPRKLA